jgi:hypothetical protein
MKRYLLIAACLTLCMAAWGQDEGEFHNWMKAAAATCGSLNKNLKAGSGEAAAADAHKLHDEFDEMHGFWEKKHMDDAAKFALQARDGLGKIAEQASAGKLDDASATFKETTANCGGCHSAHREKAADGSFKIK